MCYTCRVYLVVVGDLHKCKLIMFPSEDLLIKILNFEILCYWCFVLNLCESCRYNYPLAGVSELGYCVFSTLPQYPQQCKRMPGCSIRAEIICILHDWSKVLDTVL